MQRMINAIQNYAWGSTDALTDLYGVTNPNKKPMAELWMGAHPKSSSLVEDESGHLHSLRDLINQDPTHYLGSAVAHRFGELPFLFKVLCAAQPLSIQVHPTKSAAEIGFAKENNSKIPISAPERNYQDPNHKPELVFALTPFHAMNGFRELSEIALLLEPVSAANDEIVQFLNQPDEQQLAILFASLLNLSGQQKSIALQVLRSTLNHQQGESWDLIKKIMTFYPEDTGLFAPLLLNVVKLQPGEAMFLYAGTPHAYLEGSALEVMANSDNVLRAGLTPKHIDVPELLQNIDFIAKPSQTLLMAAKRKGCEWVFPIPVDDFSFSLHDVSSTAQPLIQNSAAILFCVNGEARLAQQAQQAQQMILKPGDSCFIGAFEPTVMLSGEGVVARVYNQL